MSISLTKGYTFSSTEMVTAAKLHSLVDNATLGGVLEGTFTNSDLTTGILSVAHGFSLSAPYSVDLVICNNNGERVFPSYTASANTTRINLLPWGTLTGTWGYIITS